MHQPTIVALAVVNLTPLRDYLIPEASSPSQSNTQPGEVRLHAQFTRDCPAGWRSRTTQVEALGEDLRNRLNAQSDQIGLLRERTAHLDGLLEGLREAITMQVPKPVAERPAALPETEPPSRPKRRIDLESEVP